MKSVLFRMKSLFFRIILLLFRMNLDFFQSNLLTSEMIEIKFGKTLCSFYAF